MAELKKEGVSGIDVSEAKPPVTNPFARITLKGFDGVRAEETDMVMKLSAALLRRLDFAGPVVISFSKRSQELHRTTGGCRANRKGIVTDPHVNLTFQAEGFHEITANLLCGDRTPEVIRSISNLIPTGQLVSKKTLTDSLTAIDEELAALKTSRIVQMPSQAAPEEERVVAPKELLPERPSRSRFEIFGMRSDCFAILLGDIVTHTAPQGAVTVETISEIAAHSPQEWKIPADEDSVSAIIRWINKRGGRDGLTRCVDYYGEHGTFPSLLRRSEPKPLPKPKVYPPSKFRLLRKYTRKVKVVDVETQAHVEPVSVVAPPAVVAPKMSKGVVPKKLTLADMMRFYDENFVKPYRTLWRRYLKLSQTKRGEGALEVLQDLVKFIEEFGEPTPARRQLCKRLMTRWLAGEA